MGDSRWDNDLLALIDDAAGKASEASERIRSHLDSDPTSANEGAGVVYDDQMWTYVQRRLRAARAELFSASATMGQLVARRAAREVPA